jgi:hypothetical protein
MNTINVRDIKKEDFTKCQTLKEKIMFVLGYAILSPSTHNTQPWLFKVENNICKIYFDPKYRLPEADPHGRDMFISIGCCVENLILAAKYFGIFENLELRQDSLERELLAKVYFKDLQAPLNPDYLKFIDTIPKRINSRGVFKDEAVDLVLLNEIVDSAKHDGYLDILKIKFIDNKDDIVKLAHLTAKGLEHAYLRKTFRKEMYRWMNNSLTRKKEGIPGYALRMPFLASFVLPTVVRFFNIGKLLAKLNYKSISSVPLITIITAKENNPEVWLKTGRLVERLMLDINSKGLQTSIFVASIEMGDLYKKVQEILFTDEIPQFLFVIGKVDSMHKPTPRHRLQEKII